jgi:hypothetical protein
MAKSDTSLAPDISNFFVHLLQTRCHLHSARTIDEAAQLDQNVHHFTMFHWACLRASAIIVCGIAPNGAMGIGQEDNMKTTLSRRSTAPIFALATTLPEPRELRFISHRLISSALHSLAFTSHLAVISLVGMALISATCGARLPFNAYSIDDPGLCHLIAALLVFCAVATARTDWQTARRTDDTLVYFGMVGVLLGLIMTVTKLSTSQADTLDNFKNILSSIYVDSATELYANLVACVGYLRLGTNAHLLAKQNV